MTNLKSKTNFIKLLKDCDAFGAPIYFNLKREETYRSTTGGIIFLILFMFSAWYCIFNFVSFATRQNQTLIYSNKIKTDIPINLTQMGFTFAVGLYDEAKGIDATDELIDYLEFTASYVDWTGFGEGTKKKTSIGMHRCNYKDFFLPEKSILTKNDFDKSFNLSTHYCPNVTNDFSKVNIAGVHSDIVYQYAEISLSVKSDKMIEFDSIKNRLADKPLKFNIYFIDTKLDFENITQPVTKFVNFLAYYIDPETFTRFSTRFSPLLFSTDENIFINAPKEEQGLMFQDFSIDSYAVDRSKLDGRDLRILARTYLQLSQKYVVCQRTYQKITSYIADMTGILSQFFLVLYVIVGYSNHIGARQKIMHRLMKFQGNKHFDRELTIKIFSDKIKNIETYVSAPSRLFSSNPSDRISLRKIDDSFVVLKGKGDRKENSKTSSLSVTDPKDLKKMNSCEILTSLICGFCNCWRIKREIIKKGDKTVDHYLDVLTYLKKMTELDYMKFLILNPDQLNLFNFIASPMVSSISSNKEMENFFDNEFNKKFTMNKNEIEHLLSSYEKFTQIKEPTPGDVKLINIFASQILKLKSDLI